MVTDFKAKPGGTRTQGKLDVEAVVHGWLSTCPGRVDAQLVDGCLGQIFNMEVIKLS